MMYPLFNWFINQSLIFLSLIFSYAEHFNAFPIIVTLVTKNETTDKLRLGVQQQMAALSIQLNLNVLLDKVVRFGMSILLIEIKYL